MMASMRLKLLIVGVVTLVQSGCASFNGRPEPIQNMDKLLSFAENNNYEEIVKNFYDSDGKPVANFDEDQSKQLRNTFISAQISAINGRYASYLIHLSRQIRGGSVGFDLISLGLSSGASIAGQATANALSAGLFNASVKMS